MKQKLIIKVCGIKFPENQEAILELSIEMLGFIFYPNSKRYVGNLPKETLIQLFQTNISKVGVFVNEDIQNLLELAKKYQLSFIQLHGKETPEICQRVKNSGFKVIKAFGVDEDFNFKLTEAYSGVVDYFIFDTKARTYGGTGKKFNWKQLEKYNGKTPFLLSGGIKPEDADSIKKIQHPKLVGLDLNSGFEDQPGLKNIQQLKKFIDEIKS